MDDPGSAGSKHAALGGTRRFGVTGVGNLGCVTDPGYSTDRDGDASNSEAGDFEDDQEREDRAPTPGNAPAPGERPSESGSTPSDITTEGRESPS
jgi:hypothetical protein